MHISHFNDCLSVDNALEMISRNHTEQFRWMPVDNGLCKFELGGNNKEIKVSVPETKDGELYTHPNNYTKMRYSVTFFKEYPNDTMMSSPGANGKLDNCDTLKKFTNMLKRDLNNLNVKFYEVPIVTYEWRMKLENDKHEKVQA